MRDSGIFEKHDTEAELDVFGREVEFEQTDEEQRMAQYLLYPVSALQLDLHKRFDYFDAIANVLHVITQHGAITFAELLDCVLHNPLTAARAVTHLIECGYVTRDKGKTWTPTGIVYNYHAGTLRAVRNAVTDDGVRAILKTRTTAIAA